MKILAPFLIPLAAALSLKVFDSTEHCFQIFGNQSQYLHFSYMTTGRNEENVNFKVIECFNDLAYS